jgi:multidrug efflux pump
MGYEWTDLTYQDRLTRRHAAGKRQDAHLAAVLLSVVLVVLVLAAQYESWSLPLAIILIVPMCILSALFGVWLSHLPPLRRRRPEHLHPGGAGGAGGPGCKNAILIVEFAKELEEQGQPCRCRHRGLPPALRPILMTSIAFCAGVIPLILAAAPAARCAARWASPCSPACWA